LHGALDHGFFNAFYRTAFRLDHLGFLDLLIQLEHFRAEVMTAAATDAFFSVYSDSFTHMLFLVSFFILTHHPSLTGLSDRDQQDEALGPTLENLFCLQILLSNVLFARIRIIANTSITETLDYNKGET